MRHHADVERRRSPESTAGGAAASRSGAAGATGESVGLVDLLAFLSELAVFALLAVSGWHLVGTPWLRLVLAVLLPVAAVGGWGLWLAPRSRRRLPQPVRVVAQLGVFAASGVLAVAAGLAPLAWLVPLVASIVFAAVFAAERQPGSTASPS